MFTLSPGLCPYLTSLLNSGDDDEDEEAQALRQAISNGNVAPTAPTNLLNGAIGEQLGWQDAIQKLGQIGIEGPGNVSANGPDYITFDEDSGDIVVWDAKYSTNGNFPSGDSIPSSTMASWDPYIAKAVNGYMGTDDGEIQRAYAEGKVVGEYYKYQPGSK